MAARLQNIENNIAADFSDRPRMFISEIHCESTQALGAEQRALVREAAEEVRDAFGDEIVLWLRDDFH